MRPALSDHSSDCLMPIITYNGDSAFLFSCAVYLHVLRDPLWMRIDEPSHRCACDEQARVLWVTSQLQKLQWQLAGTQRTLLISMGAQHSCGVLVVDIFP